MEHFFMFMGLIFTGLLVILGVLYFLGGIKIRHR